MQDLKYFSIATSFISDFPIELCNLTQLEIMEFKWSFELKSIPHCIGNLKSLKQFFCDVCPELKDIPLGLFHLPELRDLSLFQSSIEYMDLLNYNLPSPLNFINNTIINAWFNDAFNWNNDTDYWFQLTPICQTQLSHSVARKFGQFMEQKCKCDFECDESNRQTLLCSPHLLGNGNL